MNWFGVSGEVADRLAEGRPGLLPQVADEVAAGVAAVSV